MFESIKKSFSSLSDKLPGNRGNHQPMSDEADSKTLQSQRSTEAVPETMGALSYSAKSTKPAILSNTTDSKTINPDNSKSTSEYSPHLHDAEEDEPNELQKRLSVLLAPIKEHTPIIFSLALAILAILFFLIITQPNLFASISFYRTRWFALGTISLGLLLTYLGSFWNNTVTSRLSSYIIFAHSTILTLFSYAYLIRLNNQSLGVFDQTINTSIVFIPVSILVFLVNFTVFSSRKQTQLLAVAQAFFIILFSYSIIAFINVDSSFARNFSQGWLAVIFTWPAWFWLVISSISLSFISGRDIPAISAKKRPIYLIGYFLMNLEVLLAIYLLNFSYWYSTLLALVSWNFVYTNIYSLMTKKNDLKYTPRLTISIIYHFVLFVLVLYAA